ncbi:hypothetical protein BWG23_02480 [Flavobacterium oreochromis]|nr:hypothetical protein BWG23_02480 [Flavobacterium oreochromis]
MDTIENAFANKEENIKLQDKIQLLEYKKQIILQGPPGTGKTRMAKMMAEDLTRAQKILTPYEYVQYYIENYKESIQNKQYDDFFMEKLNEFIVEFPKESIINLSLERYCLGKGTNNSFCYWIEKGLKGLGRFSPGQAGATVYGIYYSKDENKYVCAVDGKTPEEAIIIIREALSDLIINENYTKARELFRFSFILKILNSYYPDKYFPIVSQKHLHTVAKIFNLNVKDLNDVEINQSIKEKFTELKEKYSSSISMANLMGHLYQKFKIKDNQIGNILIDEVAEIGEMQLIQFHPSYTYEDFVRGIVVETNNHNQPEYKVVNKTLAILAKKALENRTANYVLIIDEINRANLSSVLGELIYALEYRYDEDAKNEKDTVVESMYALKENDDDETGNKTLMLPTNLYIIGTMNTADRSVGHIDYAIRRRFAFVDVLPTINPIGEKAKAKFKTVCSLFIENFDEVNWEEPIFKPSKHLSSDFKPEEVMLGHSYFITKEKVDGTKLPDENKQIELKLKYEVVPILKEYVKDGILLENDEVKKIINGLVS